MHFQKHWSEYRNHSRKRIISEYRNNAGANGKQVRKKTRQCGGAIQSRTELHEFAIRCITALLSRPVFMASATSLSGWLANADDYTEKTYLVKNKMKFSENRELSALSENILYPAGCIFFIENAVSRRFFKRCHDFASFSSELCPKASAEKL